MEALTQKTIADSPSRMGRPSLGVVSTTARLPKALLERIDALLGPNKRAEFIREAVDEKLARDERAKPKG